MKSLKDFRKFQISGILNLFFKPKYHQTSTWVFFRPTKGECIVWRVFFPQKPASFKTIFCGNLFWNATNLNQGFKSKKSFHEKWGLRKNKVIKPLIYVTRWIRSEHFSKIHFCKKGILVLRYLFSLFPL